MVASIHARLDALERDVFDRSCPENDTKGLHNRIAYLEVFVTLLNRDLSAKTAEIEGLNKKFAAHKEWAKADLQADVDEARRDIRVVKKQVGELKLELEVVRLQVQELLERRWTTGDV